MISGYKNLPNELASVISAVLREDEDNKSKIIPGIFKTVSSNRNKLFVADYSIHESISSTAPCNTIYSDDGVLIVVSFFALGSSNKVYNILLVITPTDLCRAEAI